ncbi:hypothetical protein HDU93_002744 [Gonapodya sp. JEL0774]|nr:hypothetical protein HDU93_002744 [Gonapodya sp. JEL0774]
MSAAIKQPLNAPTDAPPSPPATPPPQETAAEKGGATRETGPSVIAEKVTDTDKMKAEELKDAGNKAFAANHFAKAIDLYSEAIELNPTVPAYFTNRAFANIKEEFLGAAIQDAERAIELDARFVKAYYRRASAYLGMGKLKEAIKDLKTVLKLSPKDATASTKLSAAEKELRRIQFEQAISVDETRRSALERLGDIDAIVVEPSYDGPHLEAPNASEEAGGVSTVTITQEFLDGLIQHLVKQGKLHRKYLYQMLRHIRYLLQKGPSVVDVPVPEKEKGVVNLVGDVHGQFYDVVNMVERCGMPGPSNVYLFNGDFVDRGSFSVEVIVLLIALKLAHPDFVHLARGNHEADDMNKVYGFEGEVKSKYSDLAFRFFSEVFEALPVAHVVGGKIFVVHGGLSREGEDKGVKLEDLQKLPRFSQPSGNPVLSDLLWADPSPIGGYTPSKRGQGFQFGPDITAQFLDRNGWDLVVRSHEVKEEGYEIQQNGKLVTVFSAPNYCDQMGNKAAVIRVSSSSYPAPPLALAPTTPTTTSNLYPCPAPSKENWAVSETITIAGGKLRLEFRKFQHVGHPQVKAMAYSPMGAGMMS